MDFWLSCREIKRKNDEEMILKTEIWKSLYVSEYLWYEEHVIAYELRECLSYKFSRRTQQNLVHREW